MKIIPIKQTTASMFNKSSLVFNNSKKNPAIYSQNIIPILIKNAFILIVLKLFILFISKGVNCFY